MSKSIFFRQQLTIRPVAVYLALPTRPRPARAKPTLPDCLCRRYLPFSSCRLFCGVFALLLVLGLTALAPHTLAQNGPTCDTYTNKTTTNGLGNNFVQGVYAVGSAVYAATIGGLSFCSSAALPVTLAYFNGRMTNAGAVLGWATAREDNNAGFQIERSRNRNAGPGLAFESIATIPSQAPGGNSVTELTYSHLDTQPLPGTNYYRLVQVDVDGTKTTSKIIALTRDGALVPVLFPNPVGASGEASIEPALSHTGYTVSDVLGRVVQRVDAPGVLSRVSLAGLPAGVYLLQVYTFEGGVKIWRVIR